MRWLWLVLFSALFLGTATSNRSQVFVDGRIYFVDADCYSRMTRVRQTIERPFFRISHHAFENYPEGTDPHTTAPMDWCIAALAALLSPFGRQSLDLAGAWISPLLGLAALAVLWAWSERRRLPCRRAMLLLFAISPMLSQGFKLGRPDHQSLLLFLLSAALCTEISLWGAPSRRAAILWGAAWGFALWTSLYEPLVLFALATAARLAILRKKAFQREWLGGLAALAGVTVAALLFDGWRAGTQSALVLEYFPRWAKSIAELAPVPPLSPQYFAWIGWLAPAIPALLVWRAIRRRDVGAVLPLTLVLATYALTCWQLRWGSYLALSAVLALPFALSAIPSRGLAWTAFFFSLLPIASQWDKTLFPDAGRQAALAESRTDYQLLRQLSDALISNGTTPVLAPWWLCPPIAYWSGQPCVAGSSHESLPGIVDTSRFYMSLDAEEARGILEKHDVRYVVAYEPSRVLSTSAPLLGRPALNGSMAEILYSAPHRAPGYLKLVFSNAYFRVYEARLTAPDSP